MGFKRLIEHLAQTYTTMGGKVVATTSLISPAFVGAMRLLRDKVRGQSERYINYPPALPRQHLEH